MIFGVGISRRMEKTDLSGPNQRRIDVARPWRESSEDPRRMSDSLANPNVSITTWGGPYTSYATAAGGPGLNSYTVAVPEPGTIAMVAVVTAGGLELVRRRRKRQAA